MTHDELCDHAVKYLKSNRWMALKEMVAYTPSNEIPDVIGFKSGMSVVIECKTSRADFIADAKKPFRIDPSKGMGLFRLYCCEPDIIKVSDLPPNWGLLYVKGSKIVSQVGIGVKKNPFNGDECRHENRCLKSEIAILYSALRRKKTVDKD